MLITVNEYSSMGFPTVKGGDVESCILRSGYIISALTDGRAEKAVSAGGKPAELVKQAAGFQTYMLLKEAEENTNTERSGSEKVSLGDYSYSSQSSSKTETQAADCEETGINVIRLLRSAGCLYAGVEVLE